MGRKKSRLSPGDVWAIPREAGGYYFVIFITSNRFGDAFGIFDGHMAATDLPGDWKPMVHGSPIYTGDFLIKGGRWKKVGHRVDLLELFPPSPEIYHAKADNEANGRIGPYGSGETAAGDLRNLAEPEARRIGLLQGTYRQIMLEEEFECHLRTRLG